MYYPKSQIITDLYTNGNELVYAFDETNYIGYYHILSNNKIYSGKNPNDGEIKLLKYPTKKTLFDKTLIDGPITNPYENYTYSLNNTDYDIIRSAQQIPPAPVSLIEPTYFAPIPSAPSFIRYFVKKSNEIRYIEVNENIYDKIKNKDSKYNWAIYQPFTIIWVIQGDSKESVEKSNRELVILEEQRQKLYGLSKYFKNYSEFYI